VIGDDAKLDVDDPRRFVVLCQQCGARLAWREWRSREWRTDDPDSTMILDPTRVVETLRDGRPRGLVCPTDGPMVVRGDPWRTALAAVPHPGTGWVPIRAVSP
jgi:hypothetical protein